MQGVRFGDFTQEYFFQPCMMVLLRGAPYLKALALRSGGATSMGSLSSCSLRHLALQSPGAGWLEGLPDLRSAFPNLESLKLVAKLSSWGDKVVLKSVHLPDVRVRHSPKLRHLELEKLLPAGNGSRHHLSMRLHADNHDMLWGDSLESMVEHTTAMWLGRGKLKAWPAGLERFLHLQLLDVEVNECMCAPPLDLGHLRCIPHVRLLSTGCLRLALTKGSWESLEILAFGAIHVAFTNLDAFVTRTKLFSFCCSDDFKWSPAAMMEDIRASCGKHGVKCYMTSRQYNMLESESRTVMRLSNKEINPPSDKEEPDNSGDGLLEKLAKTQKLVCYDTFWPRDPFKELDLVYQ